MRFLLSDEPIIARAVVSAVASERAGAVVTFEGIVRREARGRRVLRIEYEAYGPMVLATFQRVSSEAARRWPGVEIGIHHRTGSCAVGEPTVVIAAASPHRAEAFEACRFAIEQLKAEAPIWKHEFYEDGSAWIGQGS